MEADMAFGQRGSRQPQYGGGYSGQPFPQRRVDPRYQDPRYTDPRYRRTPMPMPTGGQRAPSRPGGGLGGIGKLLKGRILIALLVAAIPLFMYLKSCETNPFTGEQQFVGKMSVEQERALGLQAAPKMAEQHGGLHPDYRKQDAVTSVGQRLLRGNPKTVENYRYNFHCLADPNVVNAFALPGGQVFITDALLGRLKTEGQLAGVLGHEIGHVLARHGAQKMAKAQLTAGLSGAAVIATYDPRNPASRRSKGVIQMIGNMINMKYGREDELESDRIGVDLMVKSGYDPRALIEVMKILAEASGGRKPPAMLSTHPLPRNALRSSSSASRKCFPTVYPRIFNHSASDLADDVHDDAQAFRR